MTLHPSAQTLLRLFLGFLSVLAFGASRTPAAEISAGENRDAQPVFKNAVVAADHPLASQAGVEILQQGGNVVDAAAATAFALSVVRPASSGIGGGGFMVIWNAETQEAVALDYRERAPRKATRNMFLTAEGERAAPDVSTKGHLAAAVPGHVAGLCFAVEHYGKLDLATVLAPAIRLAREGVPVDGHDRARQAAVLRTFERNPQYRERFSVLYEQYLNRGEPWDEGDRFYSPQLRVLELIAQHGRDGFYQGPVAEAIVEEMRRGGGLMTVEDLAMMQPVVRRPLRAAYGTMDVLTMPPASSGGIALLETLNILSAYESRHPESGLEKLGHNSPKYIHLVTEALKHAFADRAEFLGDADFVKVPVQRLTSRDYAARLAKRILPDRTRPPEDYGRYLPVDDAGTTHFSVMDRNGNAVACTETINTTYGSFVVEPRFGIVFNNEMDDFTAIPGKPNAFGLLQSEANAVQPGKKPLSSMTPTIVLRDGKAVHALGASGGPRIISATLQVLLNLTRFEMLPQTAVEQPRFHHQWLPDTLLVETPLFEDVSAALERKQHSVKRSSGLAVSQAVSRSNDGLRGASDPRKHGRAAGY